MLIFENGYINFYVLLFLIVLIVEGIYFSNKIIGYFELIMVAADQIYGSQIELIELPPMLKEIELRMNDILLKVRKNERIAREAEQRKNDLVVYLAHDLKTPLTSVIGYLALLRDESQISEALKQKYLAISLDKAERLEDLINEFFEITRFNLTNLVLELSTVNITRMIEQLVFEFKPLFLEKNLTCKINSENLEKDIIIKCDVDKIQRTFDNLLRNAVNYSFENSKISINMKLENNNLKFEFMNNGKTIPEEKLSRIFEQFYRLDTARTTKTGGAGLGLAIAKEFVELHGGEIKAFSKDEVITFEVNMPIIK